MKTLGWLLNNWKAKLICLIIATILWYLLRLNIPNELPGPIPSINDQFKAQASYLPTQRSLRESASPGVATLS